MTMVPASTSPDFTIGRVCVWGLAASTRPTEALLAPPKRTRAAPSF